MRRVGAQGLEELVGGSPRVDDNLQGAMHGDGTRESMARTPRVGVTPGTGAHLFNMKAVVVRRSPILSGLQFSVVADVLHLCALSAHLYDQYK